MTLFLLLVCLYSIVCEVNAVADCATQKRNNGSAGWNYELCGDLGPSHWGEIYPNCSGKYQSPINIDPNTAEVSEEHPLLELINFHLKIENAEIENTGHSVQVNPKGPVSDETDGLPQIRIGGHTGIYDFSQFHFHWGQTDDEGSEHSISGQHFPLELHIVLTKAGLSGAEAQKTPRGLAVLAVLFKIADEPTALHQISTALDKIIQPGSKTEVESFQLRTLLPRDVLTFYRYNGSLTTPPCNEVVVWTVFADFSFLTQEQVTATFTLKLNSRGGRRSREILETAGVDFPYKMNSGYVSNVSRDRLPPREFSFTYLQDQFIHH